MKRLLAVGSALCLALFGLSGTARTQPAPPDPPPMKGTESGFAVFQTRCMSCHGNPNVPRAPQPNAIRQMSPERIYDALSSGLMKGQGDALTDDQRRMVAAFMSGRPLGTLEHGDAKDMAGHCDTNPPMGAPSADRDWNGWGGGLDNRRFKTASGITAADVPRLKLKWAFGYPDGLSAYGQPSVVAGRVFVGTDTGYVYALNAETGCVYWSYRAKAAVRSAVTVGEIHGPQGVRYGLFFGDFRANVYGLDAQTGAELWTNKVDDHFVARITAGPAFYDGRLFVPVSSSEEFSAAVLDYPCCTSRGSVVALDARTGRKLWKAWVVSQPKPTRRNSKGVQLYAPAGGSVWNSPTVDPKRHAIYFGTGDGETEPAPKTTDAVMAVDMKTGRTLWSYQARAHDAFLGGCTGLARTENCPKVVGPDLDIGNSPILQTLKGGRRVLVTATKDGHVIALDPDRKGRVLWNTQVVPPEAAKGMRGPAGIVWGGASDGERLYYGMSSGAMAAVDLKTGLKVWHTPLSAPGFSNAAATSGIPGVAFVGGMDGRLHALSTRDGASLWTYDTTASIDTVNKVPAHGGGMGSAGPTLSGGMMFVGSGYAVTGDKFGNVLLAFAPG